MRSIVRYSFLTLLAVPVVAAPLAAQAAKGAKGAKGAKEATAKSAARTVAVDSVLASHGELAPFVIAGKNLALKFGDADGGRRAASVPYAGRELRVTAVNESDTSRMVVEIDHDGDGSAETRLTATPKTERTRSQSGPIELATWSFDQDIDLDGSTYLARIQTPKGSGKLSGTLLSKSSLYRYGELELDGTVLHLALADVDADGTYGSAGDYWLLMTREQIEAKATKSGPKRFDENSMIEATEPIYLPGNQTARVRGIDAEERIQLELAPATDKFADYLHRRNDRVADRWRARFEGELAGMIAEQVQPDRKQADKPIEWLHAVDLAAAQELAKKSKKPIFADFETDWCIWCKVLDHVTYPDAEVAAFIRDNFVPVKINAELLADDSLSTRLGVNGYPSMQVVSASGDKIDEIGGFAPPAAFLEQLKKVLAKAKG